MGAIQLFSALDRDNNHILQGNELGLHTLQRLDKDKSSFVTLDEWEGDVGLNERASAIEAYRSHLLPDRFTEEDAESVADHDNRVVLPAMGFAALVTFAMLFAVGMLLPPVWLIAAFFAGGPAGGAAYKLASVIMTAIMVPTLMNENAARIETAREQLKQEIEGHAAVAPIKPPASTVAALAPPSAKGPSLR